MPNKRMKFTNLTGKTLLACQGKVGGRQIRFTTTEGKSYRLFHYQDCCEDVHVEDITGSLSDLVGSPLLCVTETSNHDRRDDTEGFQSDSLTWTFYRLATIKGEVVIRWYGGSNGYYSESVHFEEV